MTKSLGRIRAKIKGVLLPLVPHASRDTPPGITPAPAQSLLPALSPLKPEQAALAAGRLFLEELDRLAKAKENFAFETTMSGLGYLNRFREWKKTGYRIEMIFLRL